MSDNNIKREDWKYVPVDPDPDFDADRNRRLIAKTIKKTDQLRKKKMKEQDGKVRERADAIATYLKSLSQGKGETDVSKYFGRRELARLRGEEVLKELQRAKKEKERNKTI